MAFNFVIEEAVREKIAVKIALMGGSGSGKTYSSLRLATGMITRMKERDLLEGTNGKILLANTESSRGKYYANEFKYDIVNLEPPYAPELFVDLINHAVKQKYSVLIIDSSSAEWEGKGGCLELQQQAGGKYQDWKTVTPRHERFINALSDSPIHVIVTMKGKDQYEVDKDNNGKVTVTKLGVGAKQREGFEFYFTSTFNIEKNGNMAKCEKDNTHIFENEGLAVLSEEHGERIIDWANTGEAQNSKVSKFSSASAGDDSPIDSVKLDDNKREIDTLARSLVESGVDKKLIADTIKKHHKTNGKEDSNYNTIKDLEVSQKVLDELKKLINN